MAVPGALHSASPTDEKGFTSGNWTMASFRSGIYKMEKGKRLIHFVVARNSRFWQEQVDVSKTRTFELLNVLMDAGLL
jgi:hypothetical protein